VVGPRFLRPDRFDRVGRAVSGRRAGAVDYDGDGSADFAVYRSTTGDWHIVLSSTSTASVVGWGYPPGGDIPVPGDYDGDGRANHAVYRPSTGEWVIRNADGTPTQVAWGAPTLDDIPVPADYDGDGKTDIAVYRNSTGEWFVQLHEWNGDQYELGGLRR
jgi:hypothetical protein